MRTTTAERLKEYMKLFDVKQCDILEKCEPLLKKYNEKLSKSMISQYISGAFKPKQQKISILAEALDVSEAWLMGCDVPMKREMTEDQEDLLLEYNALNNAGKARLMAYARELSLIYKEKQNAEEK